MKYIGISISLIIIFFSALLVYTGYKNKQVNDQINNDQVNMVSNNSVKETLKRDRELQKYEIENKWITLSKIKLIDNNNDTNIIADLIEDKMLIYHYSMSSCFECVKKDFERIKLLAQVISKDKIMIVSDYNHIREFKTVMANEKINLPGFILNKEIGLKIEKDQNKVPFYFVNLLEEFHCTAASVLVVDIVPSNLNK